MNAENSKIGDTIRRAIADSGKSRYRLAKDAGLSQAVLWRLVNGKAERNLAILDALLPVLGLELVRRKRRTRKSVTVAESKPKPTGAAARKRKVRRPRLIGGR